MPDTERSWINDFKNGSKNAFEHIINRYKSPLINFCYRYLGSRVEAEDAAQDILVKIYNALHRFVPTSKFSTWMFTIAANHCRNIRRKKAILAILPINLFTDMEDPGETPHDQTELNELQYAVQQALRSLPDAQRTAVILSKYEDLPLDEIALVLNVSTGAVKQLIHRAKTNLKIKLNRYTH